MLEENEDRFAFSPEDIKPQDFTGEAIEINLNSDKAIFRPPHKLGQVEWDFVENQCRQLETLGFIQKSVLYGVIRCYTVRQARSRLIIR